jgi:hypothetical protein
MWRNAHEMSQTTLRHTLNEAAMEYLGHGMRYAAALTTLMSGLRAW